MSLKLGTNLTASVRENRLGASLLLLTWFIFFSRTIFLGQWYFLDDLKAIYYPLEHVYATFQHDWQLPHWSPLFGFGQPLLAWGQLGFFIPLHLLLRALWIHPIALLQISILTYFALGIIGMYWLLRLFKLAPLPAALGAGVFVFSGFNIGHLNHVNFYTATMLLPYLLIALTLLFRRPHRRNIAATAAVAACMALSGQPQVVAYNFLAAGLYVVTLVVAHLSPSLHWWRQYVALAIAGTLAFSLSSFAILPLYEFLPFTERFEDLPPDQLLEFSYPPSHAITLIFPYFFGDHTAYWGAKNFQELAAYIGIIPLVLAALAVTNWRSHRHLKIYALLAILFSIIGALGRYSPVYNYLVQNHILSTLNIPGRCVLFFDLGIALLASLGLQHVLTTYTANIRKNILVAGGCLAFSLTPVIPFIFAAQSNPRFQEQLAEVATLTNLTWLISVASGVLAFGLLALRHHPLIQRAAPPLLTGATLLTLLYFGWSYNPLTPRATALHGSPLAQPLAQSQMESIVPPRLYARDQLILDNTAQNAPKRTEALSPQFSIYQPIRLSSTPWSCVSFLATVGPQPQGSITVAVHPELTAPPLQSVIIKSAHLEPHQFQRVCFEPLPQLQNNKVILSFTSSVESGVYLFVQPKSAAHEPAYLVRTPHPDAAQFQQSLKSVAAVIAIELPSQFDADYVLLNRHFNAAANASSARWIGALSIRPYREFIEQFFANDREALDGEGEHAIAQNRTMLNMAGVTHLAQLLKPEAIDAMEHHGYQVIHETRLNESRARLYRNPDAFPRAFLVPNATFKPAADETRHALQDPNFKPREYVFITGPKPPPSEFLVENAPMPISAAIIKRYTATEVEIETNSSHPAWLVFTDATTPLWQTTVDGESQDYYVANTLFRTAHVPQGTHTVSFRYHSPATQKAKYLTISALVIASILLLMPKRKNKTPLIKNA
jgi:hypothetical protein